MTAILGISAFYHDSAACLVIDGEIVAAAQEERFTRVKHDPGFPANACRYCLAEAGLKAADLTLVGFYEKPLTKFDRLLDTYLDYAPKGWIVVHPGHPALDEGEALGRRHDSPRNRETRRAGRPEGCQEAGEVVPVEGHVRRPPRVACGVRLLPLAVRRGGRHHDRRRRRVGHRIAGRRPGRGPAADQGTPLPRLARPALQRAHLLHRLQGQLGRVQGDGAGAVRRAAPPAAPEGTHRPHLRRRVDPPGSVGTSTTARASP